MKVVGPVTKILIIVYVCERACVRVCICVCHLYNAPSLRKIATHSENLMPLAICTPHT